MRKILAKELKIIFVETFSLDNSFICEGGNPFIIKIKSKRYYIFLKNLSPSYFINSPDVTRVQLPFSPHFEKIFSSEIPFIILGYDVDNDTFVCWNPKKTKERLNSKSNVSLYSRASLQANIKKSEFKSGFLANGEKIILFRRTSLCTFFDELPYLFSSESNEDILNEPEPVINVIKSDSIINEIIDDTLLCRIKPLLLKNKVLEAVKITIEFYNNSHSKMTFKNWFNLVKKYQ
jgi:hypothetical protein